MYRNDFKTACRSIALALSVTVLIAAPMSPAKAQVTLGQIDTFEDGTTQGWTVGGGGAPPPVNVSSGGPGGAGDHFLELTSTGLHAAGGRLVTINDAQWTGNFIAAGVNQIALDANNFGNTNLTIRLLFADPHFGPPADVAVTSDSLFLPAGSGWVHGVFSIAPADLVGLLGTPTAALENATEMRIFHNPAPDFPGPPTGIPAIAATLGVDNIAAAAVPEPGSVALFAALALPAGLALRRSRR